MTRESKLAVHLEHIIFEDLPEGTRLNAAQIAALKADATPDQKARAFQRGLARSPLLLDDERSGGFDHAVHGRPPVQPLDEKSTQADQLAAMNRAGDDLCWIVDPETAKALPEAEFLESCRRYRNQIAGERGEAVGCMTIAQLEAALSDARRALRDTTAMLNAAIRITRGCDPATHAQAIDLWVEQVKANMAHINSAVPAGEPAPEGEKVPIPCGGGRQSVQLLGTKSFDEERAFQPRRITQVFPGEADGLGWCVTHGCGHTVWSAVEPSVTFAVCAVCVDERLTEMRESREASNKT